MATIRARRQADGSTRYAAYLRIRKGKAVIHTEAKPFSHRSAALSWARHREVALEDPNELARSGAFTMTLAELIRSHIESFQEISQWQRSKQKVQEADKTAHNGRTRETRCFLCSS